MVGVVRCVLSLRGAFDVSFSELVKLVCFGSGVGFCLVVFV